MPEIELFDGTVLEFPNGTAREVMDRVAKQETEKRRPAPNAGGDAPVAQGDWQGVRNRVDAREQQLFAPNIQGPTRQVDRQNARLAEARRQGEMYGNAYGQKESGGEVFGRQATNTFALGLPQLAEAYMPSWLGGQSALPGSEAHEFIKASDKARGQQSPIADIAGTVSGIGGQIAVMPATVGEAFLARGAQALGRGVEGLGASAATAGRVANVANVAGRVGSAGALGATLGGAEGAIESRGDLQATADKAKAGAIGGLAGGVLGEAVGNVLAKSAGRKAANQFAPSTDELSRVASQAYKEARDAGVWYKPQAYEGLVNDIKQTLSQEGVDVSLHPKVMAVVKRLEEDSGNAITLDKLDLLRRVAGSAAKSKEPDEGRLASMIIDKLDDFVDGAGTQAALFGDAQKGADALAKARAAYAAKSRSERITRALDSAELGANVTGSGANIDNKIRQAARAILENKSAIRGFSAEERAALAEVANGTVTRNVLRSIGKFAPSGVVSSALSSGVGATAGAALGAPAIGAIVAPAVGYVAKAAADRGTRKAMEAVDTLVRTRTVPGAAQKIADASDPKKQALARMVMTMMGASLGTGASTLANQ